MPTTRAVHKGIRHAEWLNISVSGYESGVNPGGFGLAGACFPWIMGETDPRAFADRITTPIPAGETQI